MKERSSIAVIGVGVAEMRETLGVAEELWLRAISELTSLNHIEEATVISTCNRMEIYVLALSWNRGIREVVDWMSKKSGIPASELREHLIMLRDSDATRQLFEFKSRSMLGYELPKHTALPARSSPGSRARSSSRCLRA